MGSTFDCIILPTFKTNLKSGRSQRAPLPKMEAAYENVSFVCGGVLGALRKRINQSRTTDTLRGLKVNLSDVLFDTGTFDLRAPARESLVKLLRAALWRAFEHELRPQVPMYAGALAAGLLYKTWLPGQNNIWKGGALSVLSQSGVGRGYDFVSEFSLDILYAFGLKKEVPPRTGSLPSTEWLADRASSVPERPAHEGATASAIIAIQNCPWWHKFVEE